MARTQGHRKAVSKYDITTSQPPKSKNSATDNSKVTQTYITTLQPRILDGEITPLPSRNGNLIKVSIQRSTKRLVSKRARRTTITV